MQLHLRLVPLLLCALYFEPSVGASQEQTRPTGNLTLPVFVDGEAQVVDGFNDSKEWLQRDLWVEASFDSDGDGKLDRMHVDVTRPLQTETEGLRVPVIYETSPYYSGVGSTQSGYFWDPEQELGGVPNKRKHLPSIPHQDRRVPMSRSLIGTWVPRGFAVVHSASPGTGLSQGCPTVGGDNEALAPKAVIDWLNGRARGFSSVDGDEEVKAEWCSGRVGMTGTSYNGTLPLAAATTGVDGLAAIIPISANTSYYHYYRSNGLVRHPGGYTGEDVDVLYEFIHSGYPDRRQFCDETIRDTLMADNQDRTSGDYNDFWAGRDYLRKLGSLKAATLLAHGLNDWNVMPAHSVRVFDALKAQGVPTMLYLHQGGHGGPPPLAMMNRWFSRYLYDINNGVEGDARAWIKREGRGRRIKPTAYADYPLPSAETVVMYPKGQGNRAGSFAPSPQAGLETLTDDASKAGAKLAKADSSPHRLLFATSELEAPLHISGTARINLRLASNETSANVSIWLVSLPWTDSPVLTDDIITRGWADPQNHTSMTESEPLTPGEFIDLSFDLQPDDQVIPEGARIGLMIFSSDYDFTLWPDAGTELTIDLAGTSLELPVVGGNSALEEALGRH